MEVHHHPNVEKKKFKEYFLEFLMIFLAVTLGFFAENLREHLKGSNEITNNIKSMVTDLKSDSAMYDQVFLSNEYAEKMIDTFITMLGARSTNTAHIYFLARNITAITDFPRPDTRTFEQMKSARLFELVKNDNISDSITSYYQSLKWFDWSNGFQSEKVNEIHKGNTQLFDGTVFYKIFTRQYATEEHNTMKVISPAYNPPLLKHDSITINTVIMQYQYLGSILKENDGAVELANNKCKSLINLLNKEYNLK
jgi:hypothetical protein